MTLPIGSDAWLSAWSPAQRRETAAMAAVKERRLRAWLFVAGAGLLFGTAGAIAGTPPGLDFLPVPALAGLSALAINLLSLWTCRTGWRRVARVFGDQDPPASVRMVRARTAGATMAALLVSCLGAIWVGIYPAAALATGSFEWRSGLLAGVTIATVATGIGGIRNWVNLMPIRTQ